LHNKTAGHHFYSAPSFLLFGSVISSASNI
jgi:hypothetical protein